MHPLLAEILWTNLFQNAIKHNIDNGTIKVVLTNDTLTISNTGKALSVNPDQLFESLLLSGSFNLYQSNNNG
jgi:signal transduction histidine kinase